jgi:uncharacterized membrane protein
MIIDYLLLILFTIFGALGSFFFKISANKSYNTIQLISNYNLYIGVAFYITSAIINILVLLALPYTIVLPCSSITYIWSLYLSKTYLRENVGLLKLIGVAFISLGTIIIAMT